MTKKQKKIFHTALFCLIVFTTLTVPLVRGFDAPYTSVSDADLVYAFQPLLINSLREESFHGHTGYLPFLLLSRWFRFSKTIGLIPVDNWVALKSSPEPFGTLFAPLVFSGRILTAILALVFVFSFGTCLYILTRNKTASLIASLVLSTTIGLAIQSIIIRPELLSAYFFMLSLFAVLTSSRQKSFYAKLFGFFLFSFFAGLALMAKYQITVGILVLPILVLVFEENREGYANELPSNVVFGAVVIGAIIALPFLMMLSRAFPFEPYQILIIAYFLFIILVYHYSFSRSVQHSMLIVLAVTAGVAVAFSYNLPAFSYRNIDPLRHVYESSSRYVENSDLSDTSLWFAYLRATLRSKFFLSPLASNLSYLLAFSLIALLAFKGRIKQSLRIASLPLLALVVETLFRVRYFADQYRIYIEFLIIASIVLAWISLQEGRLLPGRVGKQLIPLFLVVISLLSLSQAIHNVDTNSFSINIEQNNRSFCGIASNFTPELSQLFNPEKTQKCVEFITAGCDSTPTISSCRPPN